jgi:hypothetical protein
MRVAGQRREGVSGQWRGTAIVIVVVAVVVSGWSGAAGAQQSPTTVPPSPDTFAQIFTEQAGPRGAALVTDLERLATRLELTQGKSQITIADLRRTNLPLVTHALQELAKLLRVAGYVAGLAFLQATLAEIQLHKDTPSQGVLSKAVALIFVAAALIFAPSAFQSVGGTLFGPDGLIPGVEGIAKFGEASLDRRAGSSADPLISASRVAALRTSLEKQGMAGPALEAATQLTVLTAAILVAGAKR